VNTSASQDNQAVTVGWNNRIAGADTTRMGPPARFTLDLPTGLASRWRLGSGSTLDFMLAPTNTKPSPRKDPSASERGEGDEPSAGAPPRPPRPAKDDDAEEPPIDLSIEVADASGRTARVTLSDYGAIRRPLETWVLRRSDMERSRFQNQWELILQTFSIPLGDFAAANGAIDLGALASVSFVFDRAVAGEVSIDQVGFTDMDPAFLGARVEGSR
jgi:hypothetical protein